MSFRAIPPDRRLGGRIAVVPGSFFDSVPASADVYLLVRVLHNWSDEDCLRILRACSVAMQPGSLLLVGEQILEPDPVRGDPTDYLLDIQMMAMFGGARSRTEEEFRSLLSEAGLVLYRVMPTGCPVSIIEAAAT